MASVVRELRRLFHTIMLYAHVIHIAMCHIMRAPRRTNTYILVAIIAPLLEQDMHTCE